MSKKDKSKGDPITMLTIKKLNASIAKTVKELADLTKDDSVDKNVRVELIKLYNDQLKFQRKQVSALSEDTPTTWDGIAMRAFTDDR